MRLRRLLLASALGLGFIGLNPAVAKADPITAAVAVVSAFASTAVGSFIVNAVATVGVSWAASKLTGKNKASVAERQASVLTVSLGEVPREALIGETITAGSLVDIFNHGGKYGTDYVTRCIALADHAVEAIVGYYLDDVFYAWTGNGVQPGFNGALDLEFVNATASGTAPPARWLSASGWSNTDVGIGVTRIWISAKYDDEVWTQGLPQLRFVLRGLKAYDARKDAALGYVGPSPQTWNDPTTHKWTRNATILRYATVRGIYVEGRHGQAEHLLIGRGLTAIEAPPERIIAAANVCDEDVDGDYAPGTTLYTANGTIRASDAFIAVEEMFAAAMAGQIVQREGGVEIEPGQAKAAVVTITDGDLVVGEPVRFAPFLSDADGGRINTVVPRYIEPAQNWKDFAGPVRRSLDDIAEDGGPREMTLSLMLVTDGRQADWCAEIVRRSSRLERRASIVLPPDYAALEEGDWIAWQSDRRHDGATVRYRIESWSLGADWRMRLNLTEIASSVFGTPDPVESAALPPPAPVPVDALELDGVTAQAMTLAGDTSALPAIRLRWDTPVDAGVAAIRAEVRVLGETEVAPTRTEDIAAGVMIVTAGVGPDQVLEARLVPIGDPTRPVLPSAWMSVSTGAVIAALDPSSAVIMDLQDQIDAALGDITDLDADIAAAQSDLDAYGVEIAAARGGEASLNARIVGVNQARVDGDDALAEDITSLNARAGAAEADILGLNLAVASETEARAAAIDQVSARVEARPNLLPNPTGVSLEGLTLFGPRSVVAYPLAASGPLWAAGASLIGPVDFGAVWGVIAAYENTAYSLQAELAGFAQTAGQVRAVGLFQDAGGATLGAITAIHYGGDFALYRTENVVSPAGTARIAFQIDVYQAAFGLNGSAAWRRVKLEQGAVCTAWTDDASLTEVVAGVTTLREAVVDLDANKASASDLTSLSARTDEVEADIIAANLAIATETGGRVAAIDSLSLSIGDLDASISSLLEITGDLETGLSAIAGLALDVDGNIIGYAFANDGETGAFSLRVDQLTFVDPDGGNELALLTYGLDNLLRFQNVLIDGDLTVNGTITTPKIADRNITNSLSGYNGATININGTTFTYPQILTFTSTGRKVSLFLSIEANLEHNAAGGAKLYLALMRNGSPIMMRQVKFVGGDYLYGPINYPFEDTPPAGTHVYSIRLILDVTNANLTEILSSSLHISEAKTEA